MATRLPDLGESLRCMLNRSLEDLFAPQPRAPSPSATNHRNGGLGVV